jgi:hypothetical protein
MVRRWLGWLRAVLCVFPLFIGAGVVWTMQQLQHQILLGFR